MLLEQRMHKNSSFITLTYDDEHVPAVLDEDGNALLTLKKKSSKDG